MPDDRNEDGQLIDLEGRRAVRFTRRYPVSRAELWSAITDPDRTARWAFRTELEPRSGGALRFDYGEAGSAEGTVLEWDEPSVLEYEWGTDTDMPWRVRFELTSDGDEATLLTFDHLLPDASDPDSIAEPSWVFAESPAVPDRFPYWWRRHPAAVDTEPPGRSCESESACHRHSRTSPSDTDCGSFHPSTCPAA